MSKRYAKEIKITIFFICPSFRAFLLLSYYFAVFRKSFFYETVPSCWIFAYLSDIGAIFVKIWLQWKLLIIFVKNNFIIWKHCCLFLVFWNKSKLLLFFCLFNIIHNIKEFSCLLYLVPSRCCPGCLVFLYWVFIKSIFVVGSEAVAVCDILIFKKSWCMEWWFVVFVIKVYFRRVFDWEILDCLFWLFFVERLWFCEKEEKLWSDGALQSCRC